MRRTRTRQKVHVIRHQDVGMDGHFEPFRSGRQPASVFKVIRVDQETQLLAMSPLDEVLGNIRQVKASGIWHVENMPETEAVDLSSEAADAAGNLN
jgi:hypothetical protein